MKFDCIIMNPPYGTGHTHRTLHYDITNLILTKLSSNGKCICLMPTTLIKVNSDNKKLNLIKNNFDKSLINITEFNGNDVFDTNMKEIAIWNFDIKKDKNSEIYINTLNKKEYIKTLQQFNYYCNDIDLKILNKLKSKNNIYLTKCITLNIGIKIKQNKELLLQHINKLINKVKIYNYEFFIIVNLANGSMNATWQTKKLKNYGIVNINEIKDIMLNDTSLKTFIGFKNSDINSAKNILKLLNCNCLRYILAKTQNDQNMKSRVYEYFPDIDYSNINSEQDFYKFFNITEEEQKHIEEVMKKYK